VGVGGNANALQVARSLNISDETINLVFGEHARTHETVTRGSNAEHGTTPPPRKASAVNITITQRISDAQTKLVALRDDLTNHLDETGDEPDETALVVREELNGKISTAERNLDSLEQPRSALLRTLSQLFLPRIAASSFTTRGPSRRQRRRSSPPNTSCVRSSRSLSGTPSASQRRRP
jgi:hypothetical protein